MIPNKRDISIPPSLPPFHPPFHSKPGVAVLQDLEGLRELLGEDVIHGRNVLPELGVDAPVHGADVEQALGGPEVDLLADGLVLLGAPFEVSEALFCFISFRFVSKNRTILV